jgi:choice-of-anchor A domain-containing protein
MKVIALFSIFFCSILIADSSTETLRDSVCGNGIVEIGEDCDGGSCCSSSCTFQLSSTTCRASVGPCDPSESCTGFDVDCPADLTGSFETACSGLYFTFNNIVYSWLNYDVISFGNFTTNTGDIEGRIAVRNNVNIQEGCSIGDQTHSQSTDLTVPFAFIAGGDVVFASGAIFPNGSNVPYPGEAEDLFVGGNFTGPDYLSSIIAGTCYTPGCFNSAFDNLQSCYSGYQNSLASNADNVNSTFQWGGWYLSCQDSSASSYYVTVAGDDLSSGTITWISMSSCNPTAHWVINIAGTDDVTFSGISFPDTPSNVVYNVLGSGRTINVGATALHGTLLAPFNILNNPFGVIIGRVITGDIIASQQIGKIQCPSLSS